MRWAAPEALSRKEYTEASDIWSYGITLHELFTSANTPYTGMTNMDVWLSIQSGLRLKRPNSCPLEVYKIMRHCWWDAPEERITFQQLSNYWTTILRAETNDVHGDDVSDAHARQTRTSTSMPLGLYDDLLLQRMEDAADPRSNPSDDDGAATAADRPALWSVEDLDEQTVTSRESVNYESHPSGGALCPVEYSVHMASMSSPQLDAPPVPPRPLASRGDSAPGTPYRSSPTGSSHLADEAQHDTSFQGSPQGSLQGSLKGSLQGLASHQSRARNETRFERRRFSLGQSLRARKRSSNSSRWFSRRSHHPGQTERDMTTSRQSGTLAATTAAQELLARPNLKLEAAVPVMGTGKGDETLHLELPSSSFRPSSAPDAAMGWPSGPLDPPAPYIDLGSSLDTPPPLWHSSLGGTSAEPSPAKQRSISVDGYRHDNHVAKKEETLAHCCNTAPAEPVDNSHASSGSCAENSENDAVSGPASPPAAAARHAGIQSRRATLATKHLEEPVPEGGTVSVETGQQLLEWDADMQRDNVGADYGDSALHQTLSRNKSSSRSPDNAEQGHVRMQARRFDFLQRFSSVPSHAVAGLRQSALPSRNRRTRRRSSSDGEKEASAPMAAESQSQTPLSRLSPCQSDGTPQLGVHHRVFGDVSGIEVPELVARTANEHDGSMSPLRSRQSGSHSAAVKTSQVFSFVTSPRLLRWRSTASSELPASQRYTGPNGDQAEQTTQRWSIGSGKRNSVVVSQAPALPPWRQRQQDKRAKELADWSNAGRTSSSLQPSRQSGEIHEKDRFAGLSCMTAEAMSPLIERRWVTWLVRTRNRPL